MDAEEHGPLLAATGADAALLAREGHEEFVAAVRAADAGEAFVQIAALEEFADGLVEHWTPEAELAGVAFGVHGSKVVEVLADEAVEVGLQGLAGVVDARWLVEEADHGFPFFRTETRKAVRGMLGILVGGSWHARRNRRVSHFLLRREIFAKGTEPR